jgi:hypothetical protein
MSIADQAHKVPGVAAVEGAVTGPVATEQDPPIADYDKQTAVRTYEHERTNRAGVIQAADQHMGD